MTSTAVLLAVALIVFAGLFVYLWVLDGRVNRLAKELKDEEEE
jgi:CcmD family protein